MTCRFLIRAICASRTYQLSSVQTDPRQSNRRLFARGSIKGLSSAELAASLSQAIGEPDEPSGMQGNPFNPDQNGSSAEGVGDGAVQDRERRCGRYRGEHSPGTGPDEQSRGSNNRRPRPWDTLGALLEAPFLDTAGRIEMLYLSTLSRRPTAQELQRHLTYVDTRRSTRRLEAEDGQCLSADDHDRRIEIAQRQRHRAGRHFLGAAQQQRVLDQSLSLRRH